MASKHVAPAVFLIGIFLFQAVLYATSSVVVVGRVFCDTCSEHQFSETSSYYLPGALVAVECSINRKATSTVSIEGETDEYGEFRVEIPSIFQPLRRCSVRMLSSPERSCSIPSTTTSFPLRFTKSKSKLNVNFRGDRTYNAGSFSYRPLNAPSACFKSSSINYLRGRAALEGASHTAPPLIPNQPRLNFPPLPFPFPFPPATNPGGSPSFTLPQMPPFPSTFQSPPPAKEDGHSESPPEVHSPPLPFPFPFPTPISHGGSPSLPLPQIPSFPFTFPSPPPAPAKEDGDSESPPEVHSPDSPPAFPSPNIPALPKFTFPPIPSIPLLKPPSSFQFSPIPFLNPPPPSTEHKTP